MRWRKLITKWQFREEEEEEEEENFFSLVTFTDF